MTSILLLIEMKFYGLHSRTVVGAYCAFPDELR